MSAQVTAAGMVMLVMQTPELLTAWLETLKLKTYTCYTVGSVVRMRDELARVRALSVTMPMRREAGQDAVDRVLGVLNETAYEMRNQI